MEKPYTSKKMRYVVWSACIRKAIASEVSIYAVDQLRQYSNRHKKY